MNMVSIPAHFDGKQILLDEPYTLEPNAKLLVTVVSEQDAEREDWLRLAEQRLADAYGNDEPDYPLSCIREMNNVGLAAAYQQMAQDEAREAEALEWAEAVEGIRRGWEACEQGRSRSIQEFAAEQRAKFNLPS